MSGHEPRPTRNGSASSRTRSTPTAPRSGRERCSARRKTSASSRTIGRMRWRVVYFECPAVRGWWGTGRCTIRSPARWNSAGSQRCAPSKSGVIASTRSSASRRKTRAGEARSARRGARNARRATLERAEAIRREGGSCRPRRTPQARSASPRWASRAGRTAAPHCRSASSVARIVPRAARNPATSAAVCPLGRGRRIGRRRGSLAASSVRSDHVASVLPSSTTSSSQASPVGSSAAQTSATSRVRFDSSSRAGTTTLKSSTGLLVTARKAHHEPYGPGELALRHAVRTALPSTCSGSPSLLPPRRQRPIDLAPLHPLADRGPLVVELLPAAETELGLRPSVRPVEAERDERQPPLLDLAPQPLDLPAVEEELPTPDRVVAELARRRVGADVRADQEELVAEEARVGVLQVGAVLA